MPTNTTAGYWWRTPTLDGVVRYVGENNDRDAILQNVGGPYPPASGWSNYPERELSP
ncbi:MAG: hypothetical protein IPG92_08020 [Flavobacteriales bacterium]|nr:hypothetical protein [Flavobacteriales bacterium]